MTPRVHRLAALAAVVAAGGCADRGLAAGPPTSTSTGTWLIVTLAAGAAAGMLAALIVLPALQPGGSVLGSWVLALQAGGIAVGMAVIVGAAIRSEQLLDEPTDAEQAASLLRLSALDGGDSGFFVLIVLVTAIVGGLLLALLTLAARCAADTDPLERALAAGVLTIEVVASLVCWVLIGLGFRHLGFLLPAAALPLLVAATVKAWPQYAFAAPNGTVRR